MHQTPRPLPSPRSESRPGGFDLTALLHPAQAYAHPREVLADDDLTLQEKRAILSSWASDACAVEGVPGWRQPGDGPAVAFDDIMDALKALDHEARARGESVGRSRWRKLGDIRERLARRRRADDGHGSAALA
ncbi:MAG: hypothetical protein HXY30_09440 [Pseudorhodoplanes sp.]|nr:hypothetical protein [Pseudorhodoplanes sp.]